MMTEREAEINEMKPKNLGVMNIKETKKTVICILHWFEM